MWGARGPEGQPLRTGSPFQAVQARLGQRPCSAHLALRAGPASSPLGRKLLLITCPTRALRTGLKAQIVSTAAPQLSPVLFGKQPLSWCTKRGFSCSPAAQDSRPPTWSAAVAGTARGAACSAHAMCTAQQPGSHGSASARSRGTSVTTANCNYFSSCQPPPGFTLPTLLELGQPDTSSHGLGTLGPRLPPMPQCQGAEQTAGCWVGGACAE